MNTYRLGLNLLRQTTGAALFSVAACDSSCLLASGSASVADLASAPTEIPLTLLSSAPKLDLSQCSPRGFGICGVHIGFDTPTGQPKLVVEGSGFQEGDSVGDTLRTMAGFRFVSPQQLETDGLPSQLPDAVIEVKHTDGTAASQRVTLGIPGLVHTTPSLLPAMAVSTMQAPVPILSAMTTGDLDGDGHEDIVVAGAYYTQNALRTNPGFVTVYYGDGKGKFTESQLETQLAGFPRGLTIGTPKVGSPPVLAVTTAPVVLGSVSWLLGGAVYLYEQSPARSFRGNKLGPTLFESPPSTTIVAPVDDDEISDLIVMSNDIGGNGPTQQGAIRFFKGSGVPGSLFAYVAQLSLPSAAPAAMTARASASGPVDLAVATGDDLFGGAGSLRLFRNNGTGGFTPSAPISLSGRPSVLISGDFDNNGELDLAVPNPTAKMKGASDKLDLILNPLSALTKQSLTVGPGMFFGTALDLRQDGTLDLILVSSLDQNQPARLSMLYGSKGGPIFRSLPAPQVQLSTPGLAQVATADFNEDGKPDVVCAVAGTTRTPASSGSIDLYFGQ
jgi:hypothetical protein